MWADGLLDSCRFKPTSSAGFLLANYGLLYGAQPRELKFKHPLGNLRILTLMDKNLQQDRSHQMLFKCCWTLIQAIHRPIYLKGFPISALTHSINIIQYDRGHYGLIRHSSGQFIHSFQLLLYSK